MHLPTLRAKQRVQEQHDRDHARTPREIAVEWLALKAADGRLALDPFDRSLVILDAAENERTWGYRTLELCGFVESRFDRPGGRQRITACLETVVMVLLGLDKADAPVAADVPLASRGVDFAVAARDLFAPDTSVPFDGARPTLTLLEAERSVH